MIIYLTYNDQPSGVYWSQVTDVVDHLNTKHGDEVRLVSLVSLRGYFRSRRLILERMPRALVLPMFPRQTNWRANWIWVWLVCRVYGPVAIIGRGVFATALGLRMRRLGLVHQVCFDARAAYGAEWTEYRVVDDDRLIEECVALEREAVFEADLRLAVSQALVAHWHERFGYAGTRHLVIPCTLGRSVERRPARLGGVLRQQQGWGPQDTVLVYSGSAVGWQSLEMVERSVVPWLEANDRHRMLFLSTEHDVIDRMQAGFPDQVSRRWVEHNEVRRLLQDCDVGLLLREDRITNRVASPTKFAEYLSAGLSVVISPQVGDFSELVAHDGLGHVLTEGSALDARKPETDEVERLMHYARQRFSKETFDESYRILLACMAKEPELPTPSPFIERAAPPLVSIIVPSFNKIGYIADMVGSVQEQTDARWELIVVDDASTDGTVDMLKGLAAQDERIVVEALTSNHGANHCRNLGIRMARGRYIIFLDADDLLAPHCVKHRVDVMEGSCHDFSVSTMEVFHARPGDHGYRWVPIKRDPLSDFMMHRLPWQTMQPIWRKEFLVRIGGFDSAFSRHQDVELHTRALLVPEVRFRMRDTAPDCYYRIAEERKVLHPLRLLRGFAASAVLYRAKFMEEAKDRGLSGLLWGIIHRTYLQMLLYAKLGRIDRSALQELEETLLPPDSLKGNPLRRFLFRFTRWYNLLPLRVPGVNLIVFHLLIRRDR